VLQSTALSEPFAFRRWLLAFVHEVGGRAQSLGEQVIPAFACRAKQAALTDFNDLDSMNAFREGDRSWQLDGLATVCGEYD